MVDSALAKIVESESKNMEIHFITGDSWEYRQLLPILKGTKKFKIKKVMLTSIGITRRHLITKEEMEGYCKGIFYPDNDYKDSVNDDLESLFEDIQNGKEPTDDVLTYFLPKLTQEELKMVERKDEKFIRTFLDDAEDFDVPEEEMKASESDSKYVFCEGTRSTMTIKNSLLMKRKISS